MEEWRNVAFEYTQPNVQNYQNPQDYQNASNYQTVAHYQNTLNSEDYEITVQMNFQDAPNAPNNPIPPTQQNPPPYGWVQK